MDLPLCLKVKDWPQLDQDLWTAARKRPGFLSKSSAARNWSQGRCKIVEQAYGQWLSWLAQHPGLDATQNPGARVTPERLERFVRGLQDRVAPASVAMMTGAVKRMLDVIAPDEDWTPLADLYADLKAGAKPSRNRLAHMVSPEQLLDLGIRLMQEARDEHDRGYGHSAAKGRDGLITAMLICCPVRISNLLQIELARHLLFEKDRYWLKFSKDETKPGEPLQSELPPELTGWVDEYLQVHRRKLLSAAKLPLPTARLWIDRWGKPMEEAALRAQIEKRSRDAFGRHVWPHLFRSIAVTGLVDHAPDQFGVAPDLLGHSNDVTTRKHYLLSKGMEAHRLVQECVRQGRNAALARRRR